MKAIWVLWFIMNYFRLGRSFISSARVYVSIYYGYNSMHRYSCVIIINMLFILYVGKDPVVQNSFFFPNSLYCMQCNSTVLRVTSNIFPDGDYILLTLLLLSKQLVVFFSPFAWICWRQSTKGNLLISFSTRLLWCLYLHNSFTHEWTSSILYELCCSCLITTALVLYSSLRFMLLSDGNIALHKKD